ncbi:MAG: hypothetical protein M4D80_31410 [Myxococcota bacterium]|nr:hypothetical protein [Deltaproteobacteria bacterium]MDQ3339698.1 hypothetical protein [Myxococcota bacterium]
MLPIGSAVLTLATMTYFLWGREPSAAVWIATSIAVIGALAGALVPAARTRVHAAIAAGLMIAVGSFALSRVIGAWPFEWDALADRRYAAFIATMGIGVGIGLLRGKLWARWAAIAFAAGSALGGTLNSINMRGFRDETAWLAALGVVGGVTIISQLVRPSVRDAFMANTVWTSHDRLVRSARWAAIASFVAAPMLLLYAFGQPVAPATVCSAIAIAPVLLLGSTLVIMRRTAGVLVLAVGSLGLLAHTAATARYVELAMNERVVGYYAAFWLPAALLGLVAGGVAIWRARSVFSSGRSFGQ